MSTRLGSLPPFPEEAFVGVLKSHLSVFGPTTEAPAAFHFAAFVSALSFLVGRDAWLPWGNGRLFPNLNVALVADSGEFKSTPLDDVQEHLIAPLLPPPSSAGMPAPMLVLSGGGSGEGLIEAIADTEFTAPGSEVVATMTGRKVLVVHHEFSETLAKVRRDQAGNYQNVLLDSLDARRVMTHVTKGKTLRITDGIIVVQAASTFDHLGRALSTAANTSGLLNRFAWFGGRAEGFHHVRPPVDPQLLTQLRAELASVCDGARQKQLVLDPSADALHRQYVYGHRIRESSEGLREATKRGNIQAIKLAMLLALASRRTTVIESDVRAAWHVLEYCRHFIGLLLDMVPDNSYGELEERVAEKARQVATQQGGTFTQSDVFQRLKSKSLGWDDIDRAFKASLKAGALVLVQGSTNRYRVSAPPTGPAPASDAGHPHSLSPPLAPPPEPPGGKLLTAPLSPAPFLPKGLSLPIAAPGSSPPLPFTPAPVPTPAVLPATATLTASASGGSAHGTGLAPAPYPTGGVGVALPASAAPFTPTPFLATAPPVSQGPASAPRPLYTPPYMPLESGEEG